MQTREPQKRVNWIFVIVLIIAIPLVIFGIFMMNNVPSNPSATSSIDSTKTGVQVPDTTMPDNGNDAKKVPAEKKN